MSKVKVKVKEKTIDERIAEWDYTKSKSYLKEYYKPNEPAHPESTLLLTYNGMVKDLSLKELRDEFDTFGVDMQTGVTVYAFKGRYESNWVDAWYAAGILYRSGIRFGKKKQERVSLELHYLVRLCNYELNLYFLDHYRWQKSRTKQIVIEK